MSHHEFMDAEFCEAKGCERAAMVGSPWMKDYCSPECREKDLKRLQYEAELERLYEIRTGGQG